MTRSFPRVLNSLKSTILHSAAAGMLVLVVSQPAISQDLPPTALTIDGEPFSLNLVGTIIQQLPPEVLNRPTESYYDTVIDDIIDTHLSADAARAAGLDENPAIHEVATRAYERVLAQAFIQQAVNERLTEDMIQQSYNDLVADTESRSEVRARHILVASEDEAKAVISRLDNGEDFAALAQELSTGPSGQNGGELGYFRRGDMVPGFELVAFATASGSYTDTPVQTQYGWHVIKVEDRRIAPAPPLEEVQEQLVSSLSIRLISQIITELRDQSTITRLTFEEAKAAQDDYQDSAEQ